MVVFAYLSTNITEVVRDQVDELHSVRYSGSSIQVKPNYGGGDDKLNLSDGELFLGNIQSERPIVKALAGNHQFDDYKFKPYMVPTRDEWSFFPSLFELERIAVEPLAITGIVSLIQDDRVLPKEHAYFQEQQAHLDAFCSAYAEAIEHSAFGKPAVEGFYSAMKELNVLHLQELAALPKTGDEYILELHLRAYRNSVYQEKDLVSAFGTRLYQQLQERFGPPQFV